MRFGGICFIACMFFRWRCRRCASGRRIFRRWWGTLRGKWRRRMGGKRRTSPMMRSRSCGGPGNVRELRNVVERLVLLAGEGAVSGADVRMVLPNAGGGAAERVGGASGVEPSGTLADRTEAFEREVLLAEIRRHNFHMTNVARTLGLERSHLYKKCQQLGIDLQSLRKPE